PVPLLQRFMPRFAREFPLLKVALPTVTFKDHLVIHDGDREIQLWHPGFTAHTVGDAVAYLPKERILFAGDIAFHYVTPLAFQGHVGNWIKAANRLLEYDADVIVPGHDRPRTKAQQAGGGGGGACSTSAPAPSARRSVVKNAPQTLGCSRATSWNGHWWIVIRRPVRSFARSACQASSASSHSTSCL